MFRKSSASSGSSARGHLHAKVCGVAACLVLLVCSVVVAQTPSTQPIPEEQAYRDAIAGGAGDVLKLEKFADSSTGHYHVQALAWLVWTYRKMGDEALAAKWARDLQNVEPENALALATLANANQQLTLTSPNEPGADERVSLAKQALRGVDHLSRPEGMPDETFASLKSDLVGSLNGAVGYAYFQRHDYLTARGFLRKAVAFAPENAQYTYALALADLEGRDGDAAEGFKMLARSVNLTLGTPAGMELARYARQKYRDAGGTDTNWTQFLTATSVPPQPQRMPVEQASAAGTGGVTGGAVPPTTPASSSSAPAATASAMPGATTAAVPVVSAATSPAVGAPSAPATTASTSTSTSAIVTPPTTSGSATTSATVQQSTTPSASTPPASPVSGSTTASGGTASPSVGTASPNGGSASLGVGSASPGIGSASPKNKTTEMASVSPGPEPTKAAPASTNTGSSATRSLAKVPDLPPERVGVSPAPGFPSRPPMRVFTPDKPISLGILLETAATSPESRTNVINSLSDMVRRLREHDEAFLVSFSNEVVFEQDLTNNPKALVEAMDSIKPLQGTALFDAVAFAAGHLKRIAANENRVLLVISDGSNTTNTVSPLELSGELSMSGVKIFCIGMQAVTPEDQQRLRALADATGGRAVFLGGAGEFRGAAREVAARLGIPF